MYLCLFQLSAGRFYTKQSRTRWVAPAASQDSNVELDINEEDIEEDDDILDPDFLLSLSDDDIPVTSTRNPG